MYSHIKSVQITLSVLKAYGLQHVVVAPGGSDIPIVCSMEHDDWFKLYSVVDERSVVYFAMGLSQQLNYPVVCVCTSGTAVSNFLPGMTEAFYQDVPIVAITADKNPHFQGQIETQKIEQHNLLSTVARKSVELPVCHTTEDEWYCERLVKEAMMSCFQRELGPVHINIPIVEDYATYTCKELPAVRKVNFVDSGSGEDAWKSYLPILRTAKRILVVIGQNVTFSQKDIQSIELFCDKFGAVVSVEHLSNLNCRGCIHTYPITEMPLVKGEALVPDLVITCGNNLATYGMKPFLRRHRGEIRHLQIDPNGRYRDLYMSLSDLFRCSASQFFAYYATLGSDLPDAEQSYRNSWLEKLQLVHVPEFRYSEMLVAHRLSSIISAGSTLHLAILNSTRVMQYYMLPEQVTVFSNVGALGIDGCLSTFMGHAAATSAPCYCLIGDLSFFYDMNAAGIRHCGNNVRIILMNNGGGGEFHLFMDKRQLPTLNRYVCAEHNKRAVAWMASLGFECYTATNAAELDAVMEHFAEPSDAPKFLEVMTNMEEDAEIVKSFYASHLQSRSVMDIAKALYRKLKH